MATPYVGEIRAFGFNFAPVDWALCQGQLLPISQYAVLYNLIGTTYGGDGQTTFAVPNLQGRVPMHQGTGQFITRLGQVQGSTNVALMTNQMPAHTHIVTAGQVPSGGVVERTAYPTPTSYLADTSADDVFNRAPPSLNATLASGSIGVAGGNQPHDNEQPYLVVNFCIALYGIYPSQS